MYQTYVSVSRLKYIHIFSLKQKIPGFFSFCFNYFELDKMNKLDKDKIEK